MSPIKGLTDRGERFPEIGQIRKGAPKSEKAPGRDLDYFRVEFDEQEVESAKLFEAVYGNKPQELNVLLAFNELDRVFDAFLEAYTAGRMVARSDGEKYLYLIDTRTGEVIVKNGEPYREYKEGETVGTWHNDRTGKEEAIKLRPVGRLRVVILELKRLAYLTVMTTSIHDIINLSSQINAFSTLNGGNIAGIPFVLRRRPKEISTPKKDGGRARYTKWLLSIEPAPQWVGAKLDAMQALSMPEITVNYLPAGEKLVKANGNDHTEDESAYRVEPEDDDENWEPPVQDGDFTDAPDPSLHANPTPESKSEPVKSQSKKVSPDEVKAMAMKHGVDIPGLNQLMDVNNGDLQAVYSQLQAI